MLAAHLLQLNAVIAFSLLFAPWQVSKCAGYVTNQQANIEFKINRNIAMKVPIRKEKMIGCSLSIITKETKDMEKRVR